MREIEKTEKIKRSATAGRLKRLMIATIGGGALLFLIGLLFAALWDSAAGKVLATLFFLVAALLFAWTVLFGYILVKTVKRAGRYAFAVTESASFECFGPFLAMNVAFFDEGGAMREGRSRFLFGARDMEAWQNVPLEIAYLRSEGKRKDETRKKKPDLQPNAEIVVIGAAPKSAFFEKNTEK